MYERIGPIAAGAGGGATAALPLTGVGGAALWVGLALGLMLVGILALRLARA